MKNYYNLQVSYKDLGSFCFTYQSFEDGLLSQCNIGDILAIWNKKYIRINILFDDLFQDSMGFLDKSKILNKRSVHTQNCHSLHTHIGLLRYSNFWKWFHHQCWRGHHDNCFQWDQHQRSLKKNVKKIIIKPHKCTNKW